MVLKRFSKEKRTQVDQLIAYAQLMGLTGEDLVSVGGKMARDAKRVRKIANMEIVKGFKCLPIGRGHRWDLGHRFKLKTATGAYNFEFTSDGYRVKSLRTNVVCNHRIADPYEYELPSVNWGVRYQYTMLLHISDGQFKLDF